MKVAFDFYYRALSFYHIKHSRLEMSKKRHRPFIRERSMNWKTEKASDFQEFFFYVKRQGPYVKKAAISSKVYDNPLKLFLKFMVSNQFRKEQSIQNSKVSTKPNCFIPSWNFQRC